MTAMKNLLPRWFHDGLHDPLPHIQNIHDPLPHIQNIHDKYEKFQCDQCEYATTMKCNMKRHIQNIHYKNKKFQCDQCEYATTMKSNLTRHIQNIHYHYKYEKFQCDQCEYATTMKSNMTRHIQNIHYKNENFQCNQCEYATSMNCDLMTHMRTMHKNIRTVHEKKRGDFKCTQCEYTASMKSTLTDHLKIVHENDSITSPGRMENNNKNKFIQLLKKQDKLSKPQREAFDYIENQIMQGNRNRNDDDSPKIILINAAKDGGKTFLIHILIAYMRNKDEFTLSISPTGKGAYILPGAGGKQKTHKIPLDLTKLDTDRAIKNLITNDMDMYSKKLIRSCHITIWDDYQCSLPIEKAIVVLTRLLKYKQGNQPLKKQNVIIITGHFKTSLPLPSKAKIFNLTTATAPQSEEKKRENNERGRIHTGEGESNALVTLGKKSFDETSTSQLQDLFETYIQILMSHCLQGTFIEEIFRDRDEYFLPALKKFDKLMVNHKEKVIQSIKWSDNFKCSLFTWPCLNLNDLPTLSGDVQRCDACNNVNESAITMFLNGQPYNFTTLHYRPPSSEEAIMIKTFSVCKNCSQLGKHYHQLQHFKITMFQIVKELVHQRQMKGDGAQHDKILTELLSNQIWLDEEFRKLQDLWVSTNHISQRDRNSEKHIKNVHTKKKGESKKRKEREQNVKNRHDEVESVLTMPALFDSLNTNNDKKNNAPLPQPQTRMSKEAVSVNVDVDTATGTKKRTMTMENEDKVIG